MCKFFSLVSDGTGKVYYFDANLRAQYREGSLDDYYEPDSHTSVADYHGFVGAEEDRLNKYEYNPLTRKFIIDQLNTVDDSDTVREFCNTLDFRTIVPELVIKPIIHPFYDLQAVEVSPNDIELLEEWVNVWANVDASVVASVRDSIWGTVEDSVREAVWDTILEAVGESVEERVEVIEWASAHSSIWAYIGSFFTLEKWKYIEHKPGEYPFQPAVALWERGLVPSFDGKIWRLHGYKGEVLYEEVTKL